MLQRIRDRVQGWVAGVIIVILFIAFFFWGIEYYVQQSFSGDTVVAKVNGHKIFSKELNQAYQSFLQREQIGQNGASLSPEAQKQIKQIVLQGLITNEVLVQSAQDAGFQVELAQVEQLLASDPAFQVDGRFSPRKLQQILYAYGLSPSAFLNQVLISYLTQQVASGIQATSVVLPDELKKAYLLFKEQRDFSYAIIPANQFAKNIKVNEAQISEYYKQHQDQFMQPETVQVSYIVLSPEQLKKEIQIDDREVKQFYEDHKNNYTIPASSKSPAKTKTFSEVSGGIKQQLMDQKVEKLFSQKSDQLANLSYTNPTTLNVAAKVLGLQIQTSPYLLRQGAHSGIFSQPKVLAAVFKSDVLQSGNNSDPIELKDGGLVVLRVANHLLARPSSLSAVHDQIKKQWIEQAAAREAGVAAYKIESDLMAGGALQKKAAKYSSLGWVNKNKIARNDRSTANEILLAAFTLKLPSHAQSPAVTTTQLKNGDYAVIIVNSASSPDFSSANQQELNTLRTRLTALKGQLDYKFYIKSALDHAKLKVYSKNL